MVYLNRLIICASYSDSRESSPELLSKWPQLELICSNARLISAMLAEISAVIFVLYGARYGVKSAFSFELKKMLPSHFSRKGQQA